jgi:hypothetical protein
MTHRKAFSVLHDILLRGSRLHTTFWLFQPFLIPKSGGRIWAIGNDQSCQALGFFSQLTSSVTLYNAYLAGYFLTTIVRGLGDELTAG